MINKEKNFVSACVYVYNVEHIIKDYLDMLTNVLSKNFEHSEIILVNDYSNDNTVNKIKESVTNIDNVSVTLINLSYYHGVEMAMMAGEGLAIGDFVFEFDSTELDYNEEIIMNVYKKVLEDIDVVAAVPEKKEKLSSKIFYMIYHRFSENRAVLHTESFRVLSRRVINRVNSMSKTIPYRKAVYVNSGLKYFLYPYKPLSNNNAKKDKKVNKFRSKLAIDTLILFTDFGYKVSMLMTFIMMFVSVFVAIYSVITYLNNNPVAGWTTTILFLSLAFFGLFAVLSIVIKYLQLIINLVFKRKNYSYENIEKLTN